MILEDFFNKIETHFCSKHPFVVYRKPNETTVKAILQKTDALYDTKDFTETGFVFSPFDDANDSVLIPIENSEVITIANWNLESQTEPIEVQTKTNYESSKPKAFHINLIEKGIESIHNNGFKKVVLSRKEQVKLSIKTHPISIFKKLLTTYKPAFVYCWYHPRVGLWLGATPETLIKIEGKQFSIMALAGTQEYQGTLEVEWKEKEKEEQQIVTNFIVEQLNSSVQNIEVSKTETVKAGNLLHLKTMISARLQPDSNLKDIILAIHPTPAVCGFPKREAKQFILKNEGYNREFYTGFLGELNFEIIKAPRSGKRNIENRAYSIFQKSTQLYVNLRCMQLKNDEALVYVGGGITKSSNPENEWNETVFKSQTMKRVL